MDHRHYSFSVEKKYAKKPGVNIIFWHISFRESYSIHVFMPNEREKADVLAYPMSAREGSPSVNLV